MLPNLQLLEGVANQEKLALKFEEWLKQTCRSKQVRADFCAKHFIPEVDLSLIKTFASSSRNEEKSSRDDLHTSFK